MISFQSRKPDIRFADTIARMAHSKYPHVSSSQLIARTHKAAKSKSSIFFDFDLLRKINKKLESIRSKLDHSINYYYTLIHELKGERVGNCYEEATLAKLIGNLNGLKNIAVGDLILKNKKNNREINIDHTVAFITDKKPDLDGNYRFKNKEAIFIDPWLGFADFASNYFSEIKNLSDIFLLKMPKRSEEILTDINQHQFEIIVKPNDYKHKEVFGDFGKIYPELIIKKISDTKK